MSQSHPALSLFVAKAERRSPLSAEAREAFLALPATLHEYSIYRDVISEGQRLTDCCLLVEGCVSRYKTLPDGSRQISSFHFAGDLIDLQSALMIVTDHGIRTHSPTQVLRIPVQVMLALAIAYPEWTRHFWFDTMVDASIFREWMLNVGQRSAVSRVAHLLLEFASRLHEIGESDGVKFTMPITQIDLADAAGLSPVHTNRSLQTLRGDGLIRSYGKTMIIEDRAGMKKLSDFQTYYLYPEGPRQVA